jgi:hypothetical protein
MQVNFVVHKKNKNLSKKIKLKKKRKKGGVFISLQGRMVR